MTMMTTMTIMTIAIRRMIHKRTLDKQIALRTHSFLMKIPWATLCKVS